ncbi:MAG: hypothetical protein ACI9N0_001375 [Ilumatobacter sp.]|jgi:hypothetical protein
MLAPQRKFLKGLLFGLLAGFALGAALNDKQRKQLASEIKRTAAPLGKSIANGVSQVADTAVDEATGKIDDVGNAAATLLNSSTHDAAEPATDATTRTT